MNCYNCQTELIWGGDHDIEDLDIDGILTNLSCSNKKCNTQVEVYHYFDNEEEKPKHFAEGFYDGDWESDN